MGDSHQCSGKSDDSFCCALQCVDDKHSRVRSGDGDSKKGSIPSGKVNATRGNLVRRTRCRLPEHARKWDEAHKMYHRYMDRQ